MEKQRGSESDLPVLHLIFDHYGKMTQETILLNLVLPFLPSSYR
jgi:hypothetical protein